jgi:hypothetical protein
MTPDHAFQEHGVIRAVQLSKAGGGVVVKETFDAESENTPKLQRQGWQAVLDNFTSHVEGAPHAR